MAEPTGKGLLERIEWLFPLKGKWLRRAFIGLGWVIGFILLPLALAAMPFVGTYVVLRDLIREARAYWRSPAPPGMRVLRAFSDWCIAVPLVTVVLFGFLVAVAGCLCTLWAMAMGLILYPFLPDSL